MRFFHLSDLHIGLKLYQRDLRADQLEAFDEVISLALEHKPDAILVAGDIYDKSIPSAEAVEVFDGFVDRLHEALPEAALLFIAGNHDNAQRIDCFRSILKRQNVYMVGLPPMREEEHIEKVTLIDSFGPVHFYLLPYVKPSMVRSLWGEETDKSYSYDESIRRLLEREKIQTEERNVLVSHQFFLPKGKDATEIERTDTENVTVGNIDAVSAEYLKDFDYVALGHIHKKMKVGEEKIRYCGTPICGSVSEAGQSKSILMIDLFDKSQEAVITELPLHPSRTVRLVEGSLDEVLMQSSEDYVTVVLTDEKDLDTFDMKESLRLAYPNLLEIRRKYRQGLDFTKDINESKLLDPIELLQEFFTDMTEDERAILEDVMTEAKEALFR